MIDPNPNNSYKTKKNFIGFYTEVNPSRELRLELWPFGGPLDLRGLALIIEGALCQKLDIDCKTQFLQRTFILHLLRYLLAHHSLR